MIYLSSKREKGLWAWAGPNSPPVSTKGHTRASFCGGGAPGYGDTLGYKEEAPGNLGAVGGEPSRGAVFLLLVVCARHYLPSGLPFRAYNNPILKTEFLHISQSEENVDIGDLCPFPLSFAE